MLERSLGHLGKDVGYEVKRPFVDHGSFADIMFCDLFQKLGLKEKDLIAHKGNLIGFTGDTIAPKCYVKMKVTFLGRGRSRTGKIPRGRLPLGLQCHIGKTNIKYTAGRSLHSTYGDEISK
jgi:hypothetical protein